MKNIVLISLINLFFLSCVLSSNTKSSQNLNFERFEKSMKGVRFSGFFTVDGSAKPPSEEVYEIQSVQKFGNEDLWIFTARVKYGGKDITLPMLLPVKWIGTTPVIAMNELNIPGLGVFSAYVIIDNDKYAGTWGHKSSGGHLFGKIEKIP